MKEQNFQRGHLKEYRMAHLTEKELEFLKELGIYLVSWMGSVNSLEMLSESDLCLNLEDLTAYPMV